MLTWHKICPLQVSTESSHAETWIARDSVNDQERSYKVNVHLGKPIDILSLKETVIENFAVQVEHHRRTRTALFSHEKLEKVNCCPICNSPAASTRFRVNIYGGRYYQCPACSHCFLIARPSQSALEAFYATNNQYAAMYVDKNSMETRVKQVAAPKAEWMIEQFTLAYGRKPTKVLDIGAGGGHFVYAARQLGLEADGIEVSEASRKFCQKNFGFKLEAVDFPKEWNKFSDVDIITFWGLIEHVPEPLSLLRAAHQALHGRDTMAIASSPNWNSFSTAIQTLFPNSVVRHLDPLGHPHIFTDSSLATAFEISGFAPTAAWYFGMDIYELLTQLALSLNEKVNHVGGELLSTLQNSVDTSRLSDTIVLAGKPKS
ncbi:class I SAM-dependent methyltransferase [Chloroflexota bacterium]